MYTIKEEDSPEQHWNKNGLEIKQVKKYFFVTPTLQKTWILILYLQPLKEIDETKLKIRITFGTGFANSLRH